MLSKVAIFFTLAFPLFGKDLGKELGKDKKTPSATHTKLTGSAAVSALSPAAAAQAAAKEAPIPQKSKMCQLYEGKYLAYYDNVFVVRGCKRYFLSGDEVYLLTRNKSRPLEEKNIAAIVQALPNGGLLSDEEARRSIKDSCAAYNHLYVTDGVEIYWVDNCKLDQFPDWASYEVHRGSLKKNPPVLRYLSAEQFATFKRGKILPSVINEEYRELALPVATLPMAQACGAHIGHFVSYLDQIFYIEASKGGCVRREVDAEVFTNLEGRKKYTLQELTSSQFLSIPVGNRYVLAIPRKEADKAAK
jgi:hypothetical protein